MKASINEVDKNNPTLSDYANRTAYEENNGTS